MAVAAFTAAAAAAASLMAATEEEALVAAPAAAGGGGGGGYSGGGGGGGGGGTGGGSIIDSSSITNLAEVSGIASPDDSTGNGEIIITAVSTVPVPPAIGITTVSSLPVVVLASISHELCAANDHQSKFAKLGYNLQRHSLRWLANHQRPSQRLFPAALKRDQSRQFLRKVLFEDFLHGQGDDDFVAALEK